MSEIVLETGKRKSARARVRLKKSNSLKIVVNKRPLEEFDELFKLKVMVPLEISGIKNLDIKVNVKGGGLVGQAEAIAQGIAKGLIKLTKNLKLRNLFIEYDRHLLVRDPRVNEPHKPSRSKKGARRRKQLSKR